MQIRWLGHSSFLITENGTTILTDPYDRYVGMEYPKVKADVVCVSHNHKDHSALYNVEQYAQCIDSAGDFCYNGIRINSFLAFHDDRQGILRGSTLVFTLTFNRYKICHMGDVGVYNDEVVDKIGNVDILLIPIGGKYTIDYSEAKHYIDKISPRVVIPMHYKDARCVFDIDAVDRFASAFDNKDVFFLETDSIILDNPQFLAEKPQIIILK